MTQLSPAAICAGVGGQGKSAASAAASWPASSEPVAGGPVVPVCTTKLLPANPPPLSKLIRLLTGFVQLTGTGLPDTEILGWLWSELHSMMTPRPGLNPVPLTLTVSPSARPVAGITDTCRADWMVVVVAADVVVVFACVVVVVACAVVLVVAWVVVVLA